ncbi:hypothetical protein C7440_2703 [Pusillimonas noertemannii]|uniref:Uncharacterized protein n=1 Tax=Pusillimonas noertemannii TaxID=305977 RepID=A0A2U1CJI1_9BURK|nr:hypothetical protein C7440_2703 [Pusillimonas noertemannii]
MISSFYAETCSLDTAALSHCSTGAILQRRHGYFKPHKDYGKTFILLPQQNERPPGLQCRSIASGGRQRISSTASMGRPRRVPFSVTTKGLLIRMGWAAMASSNCASLAPSRPSSA